MIYKLTIINKQNGRALLWVKGSMDQILKYIVPIMANPKLTISIMEA
jgi:hypothetical protein